MLFIFTFFAAFSILDLFGIAELFEKAIVEKFGKAPLSGTCLGCILDNDLIAVGLVLFAAMTACIWSIAHNGTSLAFVVSKLFRPIVKPVLSWMLYRFQESDKGILTLTATGGGALAKLVQQAIKTFG